MEIIGLGYKAGTGKDWIAKHVLRPLGYQNVAFAWNLKTEVMRQYGFSYDDVFHNKPTHVRDRLQDEGVMRREQDEGYWIKRLDAMIQVLHNEGGVEKFVITDVRFVNELQYIWDMGGKAVKVHPGDRPYPLAGTMAAHHESETALDWLPDRAWDAVITNGTDATRRSIEQQLRLAGVLPDRGGMRCREQWELPLGDPEE